MKYTAKDLKQLLKDINIESTATNKIELLIQCFDAELLRRETVLRRGARPRKYPPKEKKVL